MLFRSAANVPALSLPLGGAEPFPRRAHPSLAAMLRLQADMLLADGDDLTARALRRRARTLEIQQAKMDLTIGAKVIVGVIGHA